MAVRKWSVSIEEDLAARVEGHVNNRGLSAFVAKAVEHELERDALAGYLDELDAEFGAPPDELVEEYGGMWP
jgi:metal-responsive CopG/Arc/MetJ family transcriptional regulator